jgi:hypothetical protein
MDRYRYKKAAPDVAIGFTSRLAIGISTSVLQAA